MMPLDLWLAFVAASAILLVIPGPTILTVISYSMAHGRRVNHALVGGVALGDAAALGLSVAGLGPLLAASSFWFSIVKFIGGMYLIYLGARMIRSGVVAQEAFSAKLSDSRRGAFANTFLVTALNPKGIVFFIAFLPQFVSPSFDVAGQLWIMALTFVVLATINTAMYVVFASTARSILESSSVRKGFNIGGGVLLSVAGLWALLSRR